MLTPFDDTYFMKKAFEEAQIAFEKGEIPVGVVVVIKNRIIARGHNLTETLNDVTAHAEMQSITAAASFLGGKYLKGCTMYVTLEPCAMCAGAIVLSRIPRVVYAASDPKAGMAGSLENLLQEPRLNHRCELTSGVRAEESAELLRAFFQSLR